MSLSYKHSPNNSMAMVNSNSDDFEFEDRLNALIEVEDEILRLEGLIENTLYENVRLVDEPSQRTVIEALKTVFYIEFGREEAEDFTYHFINVLKNIISEDIDILRENEASDDFIRFLIELSSKYQLAIHQIRLRREQGPNYWQKISTDYIIRGPEDMPGMNYEIKLGRREEPIQLTVSLDSNLSLISHLLVRQYRSLDYFGESAAANLDEEQLDAIIDIAKEIKEAQNKASEGTTEGE